MKRINKIRLNKYVKININNDLERYNSLSVIALLYINQIKDLENGFVELNLIDVMKDLGVYNSRKGKQQNIKDFKSNILHELNYFDRKGFMRQILRMFKMVDEENFVFKFEKDNMKHIFKSNEEKDNFFLLGFEDILGLTQGLRNDNIKLKWIKLYFHFCKHNYRGSNLKLEMFATNKLEWNFNLEELIEFGFTKLEINKKMLDKFMDVVNKLNLYIKVKKIKSKTIKIFLEENGNPKSGKFSKYLSMKGKQVIYQFVIENNLKKYKSSRDSIFLRNFNSKAFKVLDEFKVDYHFSRTERKYNSKSGKACIKGWNIKPKNGKNTWNDNETLPDNVENYVYPVVVFHSGFVVIDIDDLNNEMKEFYANKFGTLYENSNNGIHLLFKNDLDLKNVPTHVHGVKYRSNKCDFLNENIKYDIRGLNKSAVVTKLDGWNKTDCNELKNVSEFFDLIDLVSLKYIKENKLATPSGIKEKKLEEEIVDENELNNYGDELNEFCDELFGF